MLRKISVVAVALFACSLLPARASLPASHVVPSSIFKTPATVQSALPFTKTPYAGRRSLNAKKVAYVCYYVYQYVCYPYVGCRYEYVYECY